MATKTIGLDEEAYERLEAEKRAHESFSDTVKRITDAVAADWRHGLGKYSERSTAFESATRQGRESTSEGLARRQREVIERLEGDDQDER